MTARSSEDPILLCCLLWAHEGKAEALHAYENRVLQLIQEHGGEAAVARTELFPVRF